MSDFLHSDFALKLSCGSAELHFCDFVMKTALSFKSDRTEKRNFASKGHASYIVRETNLFITCICKIFRIAVLDT